MGEQPMATASGRVYYPKRWHSGPIPLPNKENEYLRSGGSGADALATVLISTIPIGTMMTK